MVWGAGDDGGCPTAMNEDSFASKDEPRGPVDKLRGEHSRRIICMSNYGDSLKTYTFFIFKNI